MISFLDAVYVWHGRGSSEDERKQARGYAGAISSASETMEVHEFEEGSEDPMFWEILGDGFASADFWKFRPDLVGDRPKLYQVVASNPLRPVRYQRLACTIPNV